MPFLFDRFRQGDASLTRQYGGLGLGLAIVKQLVELHGGTVRAESAGAGTGSSFIVNLPLAAESSLKNEPIRPGANLLRWKSPSFIGFESARD